MPENEGQSAAARATEATLGAVSAAAARGRAAGLAMLGFGRRHALGAAAAAAVVGGLLLLYAETLELYRLVTPDGATANAPGSIRDASDQHSWALGVMGVVIALAALLARATRQRLPAWAALVISVIALAIVLIGDLPDVTSSGVTTEIETADAEPQAGFWLELAGVALALAGTGALAHGLSRTGSRRAVVP
jgi:hypothetical protein